MVKASFTSLEGAITGGLTIFIAFAPEIIKWVGNLFKADTTTKSLNQTLREHKLILQSVIQARRQGDQNAQQELVNLELLYNASQDQNLSLTERKKAVPGLSCQISNLFGEVMPNGIVSIAFLNLQFKSI